MIFRRYMCCFLAALLVSSSLAAGEVTSESAGITFTNSSWEDKTLPDDVYDAPYKISLFSAPNGEDSERVWS